VRVTVLQSALDANYYVAKLSTAPYGFYDQHIAKMVEKGIFEPTRKVLKVATVSLKIENLFCDPRQGGRGGPPQAILLQTSEHVGTIFFFPSALFVCD
jgi:hypothetical protein